MTAIMLQVSLSPFALSLQEMATSCLPFNKSCATVDQTLLEERDSELES
jgi:hypothetical protein